MGSWTVDGILYLRTGKGKVDHTISAATNKDCAMLRVIKGTDICSDFTAVRDEPVQLAHKRVRAVPTRQNAAPIASQQSGKQIPSTAHSRCKTPSCTKG